MIEPTVLFVDDEANILRAIQRLCRREDFTVLSAGSGEEALAILGESPAQVIISDFRMPGMNGVDFLSRAKEIVPDSIRMILSGFADVSTIVDAINRGEVYRFLGKPWEDGELIATIHQALEHAELRRHHRELVKKTHDQNAQLKALNENLGSIVNERTQALLLSQEVLEHLPVAVMGISHDGDIMLANARLTRQFPAIAAVTPGTAIEDALPADLCESIRESMANDSDFCYEWANGGSTTLVTIAQLGRPEDRRGCVVVWSPRPDMP